jgi:hypothetical protein
MDKGSYKTTMPLKRRRGRERGREIEVVVVGAEEVEREKGG